MKKWGLDIGAIMVAVIGVVAAIQTGNDTWYWLAVAGLLPARRLAGLKGGGAAVLALALAAGGCSASSAFAPVLDAQGIYDAAGVTAQCIGAESAVVAPAFEVDWSGNKVTFGGGVFIGCESELFQFRCVQVKPANPDDKPVWKCEPLSTWAKQ